MQFQVKYDSSILWKGKTQFFTYTLHRALVIADEGWMKPGYMIAWENGTESDVAEVYVDDQIEPGNGLYGDQLGSVEETDKPLPEPDRRDVEYFAELFRELCEGGKDGIHLLDSEILI